VDEFGFRNSLSNVVLIVFGVGLGLIGISLIYSGHPHIGFYAMGMQGGCVIARFVLIAAIVPSSSLPGSSVGGPTLSKPGDEQ
jgi:hypothetical protein